MFDQDMDGMPTDWVGIFTNLDFVIGFVLPVALLGAAFAMLKHHDGQLTRSGYIECCIGVFVGALSAFLLMLIVQYFVLKYLLGIELPIRCTGALVSAWALSCLCLVIRNMIDWPIRHDNRQRTITTNSKILRKSLWRGVTQ